ncbi:Uncharacterized protein dnm_072940 [Desulfonema magnum]|uniref:Uncharacterized protein n=1 Tax=Desulfonema magnum TaxID=45655 RepID=A0A975GRS1_9BACT|nr:Uncharacterized protein dnm_072940 [Desulfonema magnum]
MGEAKRNPPDINNIPSLEKCGVGWVKRSGTHRTFHSGLNMRILEKYSVKSKYYFSF